MLTPAALAHAIWAAGVAAVEPGRLFSAVPDEALPPAGPLRLCAIGKAAGGLAEAAHARVGDRISDALVVTALGAEDASHPYPTLEGGHPVPTEKSVVAGRAALALARRCADDGTPLLVLISGGASALVEVPAGSLSLSDIAATTDALLRAGAAIGDLNVVRKHLSAIKGGQLAAAADPAPVWTLALSDVIGDDPATIGSGPTAPDPSTFADAQRILADFDVKVPDAVLQHLSDGAASRIAESPASLRNAQFFLLGSNADALAGAAAKAHALGLPVTVASGALAGEARDVGREVGAYLRDAPSGVYLRGGETTVTVCGPGRGGRNQELALAAALALEARGRRIALLSAGTDGVDGPTPAAGAVITSDTATVMRGAGLDPEAALDANDSFGLFENASAVLPEGEGLVRTGPTGTNVMDLLVGVVADAA